MHARIARFLQRTIDAMQSEYPLLITLGILLVVNPYVKSLMGRLGLPALVGYIALGFVISALNRQAPLITPGFENTFSVLAQLGVVALLFRVGLKSHTRALLKKLPTASIIWIGDVVTNVVLGFLVCRYLLAFSVETSLAIATAFSATSVAVSVAVWQEAHKLHTSRGQLLLDVAELDDLSGVLLLAVLLAIIPAIQGGEGALLPLAAATTFYVILKLALFISGCYLFAHYLEAGFTRFSRELEGSTTELSITILGAGIVIAVAAGYLGFSLAIGALFAGLAFSRDPVAVHTDARFSDFYEFLTPFFFIHIGMQMNPGALLTSLDMGMVLFVAAVLGKVVGVAAPALLSLAKADALILGVSMLPRAEIALVVVYQCRQLGDDIISAETFAAMVTVCFMTSVVAPPILRMVLSRQPRSR